MGLELWAVEGDKDSHGEGSFKTPSNTTVKIGGKNVIVKGDHANPDNAGHSDPAAQGTSGTVLCYGIKIHRNNDTRNCGAQTIVQGQSTVKSG